ncbi:Aste57867_8977 [Aphanomyces stellatus]|uniref:Aste57867_8977 protein n=1 Tax=Aphanomyces stellatus TaxID=120398 RepID=A0A485KLN1_9STRA|nr:hypothetical protein As57867_008942 [Aphanomyces stellatus]VFT85861.1 Aste57867_8977 [Aphanomyces stellatus]
MLRRNNGCLNLAALDPGYQPPTTTNSLSSFALARKRSSGADDTDAAAVSNINNSYGNAGDDTPQLPPSEKKRSIPIAIPDSTKASGGSRATSMLYCQDVFNRPSRYIT